eukprot:6185166-Pleurochrysis_carterae.AAC.3
MCAVSLAGRQVSVGAARISSMTVSAHLLPRRRHDSPRDPTKGKEEESLQNGGRSGEASDATQ